MNKIKDIIYDKSDVLIAILILAIAALIIFWRLGIILEYPKEIIGTDEASTVLTEPDENADAAADTSQDGENADATKDGDAAATTDTDADASKEDAQSTDANKDTETQTGETGEVTKSAKWDGDKLAADLEVKLVGTTAYEAVMCLVDAGVFKDYEEYEKICDSMKYDDEKMRAGVFTFAKGSTREDIIKEVNWS